MANKSQIIGVYTKNYIRIGNITPIKKNQHINTENFMKTYAACHVRKNITREKTNMWEKPNETEEIPFEQIIFLMCLK